MRSLLFEKVILYFRKPFFLEQLHFFLQHSDVRVLDIGSGNYIPAMIKRYYPAIKYYGLDRVKEYNRDAQGGAVSENFYAMELPSEEFDRMVPFDFFDVIVMSHVLEHIPNSKEFLPDIIKKVKRGGILYMEFPSQRSTHLPRLKGWLFRGGLNFYDDPTHINIYSRSEIEAELFDAGCEIVRSNVRRSWKRIVFLPFYILYSLKEWGYINGGAFWDVFGFAEYIIAQKK